MWTRLSQTAPANRWPRDCQRIDRAQPTMVDGNLKQPAESFNEVFIAQRRPKRHDAEEEEKDFWRK